MAYVSNSLTHFVGRSRPSDKDRYELLCEVIRGGVLMDPSHKGRRDPIFRLRMLGKSGSQADISTCPGLDYSSYPNVRHDAKSNLSDNSLLRFEIVCFCDIPDNELAIHCAKYGHFGLAFSKQFLVSKGASPVMYVPRPGWYEIVLRSHDRITGKLDEEMRGEGSRASLMDAAFDFHNHELAMNRFMEQQERMREAFRQLKSFDDVLSVKKDLHAMLLYQTTIEAFIFGYLKFFDPTLPPEDIDNYYMEREWRVAGKVEFGITDIESVYVAPPFVDQALNDFPALVGRVRPLISNP